MEKNNISKKLKVLQLTDFRSLNDFVSVYYMKYINNGKIIYKKYGFCYNYEIEEFQKDSKHKLSELNCRVCRKDDLVKGHIPTKSLNITFSNFHNAEKTYKQQKTKQEDIFYKRIISRTENELYTIFSPSQLKKCVVEKSITIEHKIELDIMVDFIKLNTEIVSCHLIHNNFGIEPKVDKYFYCKIEMLENIEKLIDEKIVLNDIGLVYKEMFLEQGYSFKKSRIEPSYIFEYPNQIPSIKIQAKFVKINDKTKGDYGVDFLDYYSNEKLQYQFSIED